jgi:hypothetical protein
VCTNEGQAVIEQCLCVPGGLGLSKGSRCVNGKAQCVLADQHGMKGQLVLMEGTGQYKDQMECVLRMVVALKEPECRQNPSQGSARFTVC